MANHDAGQEIVYTPNDVSTLSLAAIKERREHPDSGVRCYIPTVDKVLKPCRGGELVTVMGRPSNYKSGFMQYWARHVAQDIAATGNPDAEMVVYITWEMAVEELGVYDLAAALQISTDDLQDGKLDDAAWERLQAQAMKRAALPLWIIGHSIERRHKRPNLSLSNIAQALTWIDEQMGKHPRIVFLDYLQLMQAERGEERRTQVIENVHRSKDMSYHLGCPVVLGVQAGRQVDERNWKLPEMGDGLESSSIEHAADKMLSLWMPKQSLPVGSTLRIPGGDVDLEVTENLLICGVKKQRMGAANRVFPLYVDPTRNTIAPMELRVQL